MRIRSICSASLLMLSLGTIAASAQDKASRPSPPSSASCTLNDGKKVTIDYSRPSAKGRKVYGELVPFNKEWRTGANEATTLHTEVDLTINTLQLPAGDYTIYTEPSEKAWQLVVSKKTGQWGIPYPGKEFDFGRTAMRVSKLSSPVEQFTIGLDEKKGACTLKIDWETTRASVDLKAKK